MKTINRNNAIAIALFLFLWTVQTASALYAPNQQRWVNRDPIQEAGGVNLYSFVFADPLNKVDSFGTEISPYPVLSKPDPSCVAQCDEQFDDCLNDRMLICGVAGGVAGAGGQWYNKTGQKPRSGVAGGGPSGRYTSRSRLILGKDLGKGMGRVPVEGAGAYGALLGELIALGSCANQHGNCVSQCPTVPDVPPFFNTYRNAPPVITF